WPTDEPVELPDEDASQVSVADFLAEPLVVRATDPPAVGGQIYVLKAHHRVPAADLCELLARGELSSGGRLLAGLFSGQARVDRNVRHALTVRSPSWVPKHDELSDA